MTFRSRQVLTALAGVILCGMAHVVQAQADWKPSRPVKIVVPYPPGGSADILVRYIGPTITERLGQPIVRALQARFRHDSAAAMKRAIREFGSLR